MGVGSEGPAGQESIELVVKYERMNTFFADYSKNISRGGTVVVTQEPLPLDTEFVFALAVPELEKPLLLRAKVMRRTTVEEESAVNPAGMEIQFQYRDQKEKLGLEGIIEQLMVNQLGLRHTTQLLGRPPIELPSGA